MPIIKDKYQAKGVNPRSKFVTRKFNQAIQSEVASSGVLNTEQKQAETTEAIRISSGTSSLPQGIIEGKSGVVTPKTATIIGASLVTVNSVENIFTLNKGESLMDIIISHYHASGTASVVGLYWSSSPAQDLSFTIGTGIITATEGGTIYRLLTDSFTSSSTLSIRDSGLYTFNNIGVDVYFYALCSVVGVEITVIKG